MGRLRKLFGMGLVVFLPFLLSHLLLLFPEKSGCWMAFTGRFMGVEGGYLLQPPKGISSLQTAPSFAPQNKKAACKVALQAASSGGDEGELNSGPAFFEPAC